MKVIKQYPVATTGLILLILFSSAFLIQVVPKLSHPKKESLPKQEEHRKEYPVSEEVAYLLDKLKLDTITSCSNQSFYGEYFKTKEVSNFKNAFKIYLGILQYETSRKFENAKEIILTKEEVKKGVETVFGKDVKYQDASFGNGKSCSGGYDSYLYDKVTKTYTLQLENCICKTETGKVTWKVIGETIEDTKITATVKFVLAVQTDEGTMLYHTIDKSKEAFATKTSYTFEEIEDSLNAYTFTFEKKKDGEFHFTKVALVK